MIHDLLMGFAEYAVIIPGMLICLIPVHKWSRIMPKRLYPVLITSACLLCFAMTVLDLYTQRYYHIDPNLFLAPILVICLGLYFVMIKLEKIKLVYVFLCSMASMSIGGFVGNIVASHFYPTGNYMMTTDVGLLSQWIVNIVVFMIFMFVMNHNLRWMMEHFHNRKVWTVSCIIPAIITGSNIFMLPHEYTTMNTGRVFQISIVIEVVLTSMFFLYQYMFYKAARTSFEKFEAEYKSQLTDIQVSQYESLRSSLNQSERLRHDFKHTVRTINELLNEGEYDELRKYINEYYTEAATESPSFNFCEHLTANAIIRYYYSLAVKEKIKIQVDTEIPGNISISDVDLCMALGNILENAVQACTLLPECERHMDLSADVDNPGELYIVLVNSFDGHLLIQDGNFNSTKRSGNGIGLSSVSLIAEKYDGTAEFKADGKEFISNIMLKY